MLSLTHREYALLEHLLRHPRRVQTRSRILNTSGTTTSIRWGMWSRFSSRGCAARSMHLASPLSSTRSAARATS